MEERVKVNYQSEADPGKIAQFVQVANQYSSTLYIEMDDTHRVNAKSIMGMMNFLVEKGQEVVVKAEGADAKEALAAMAACLSGKA